MDNLTEARRTALRKFVTDNGGHAAVVAKFRLSPSQASYLSQLVARDSVASFGELSAKNWQKHLKMNGNPLLFPQDFLGQGTNEPQIQTSKPRTGSLLVETLENLSEILRNVPAAERETIAAVLAGLARTPEVPSLTAALITLLEKNGVSESAQSAISSVAIVK
jgi:hypothetical protein